MDHHRKTPATATPNGSMQPLTLSQVMPGYTAYPWTLVATILTSKYDTVTTDTADKCRKVIGTQFMKIKLKTKQMKGTEWTKAWTQRNNDLPGKSLIFATYGQSRIQKYGVMINSQRKAIS